MDNHNNASGERRKSGDDRSLVGFLASIRLTIVLLILLALVSIIGTVVVQKASEADYLRYFSRETYEIFKSLGFLDVYHSWWFNSLLALLCVNLFTCSIKNFPRTWKTVTKTTRPLKADRRNTFPFRTTIAVQDSVTSTKERLIPLIRSFLGSPAETTERNDIHLFVEKAKFSRLSVYVTHASVIIILVGGLVGSLWGFRGNVNIVEGESVDRVVIFKEGMLFRDLGFTLRCDDFQASFYPSGIPKTYRSTLTIIEDGKEILTKDIEVNHPLRYKGLSFYQSSYGIASHEGKIIIEARKANSETSGEVFSVEPGNSFDISQSGLTVKTNRFFRDFVLDKDGNAANQSREYNNPAVELLVFENEELQYRTWVFQKFPSFHGSKEAEYNFFFRGFEGKQYTGLQVTKDPGVPIVWAGCILMVLGILYTFFVSHRQLWVCISPENKGTKIIIAGTANKNRLGFKKDFEKFSTDVKKNFNQ